MFLDNCFLYDICDNPPEVFRSFNLLKQNDASPENEEKNGCARLDRCLRQQARWHPFEGGRCLTHGRPRASSILFMSFSVLAVVTGAFAFTSHSLMQRG